MSTTHQQPHRPPYVKEVLPDIAGGETNLLPASATQVDLDVWFPVWPIPTPGPNPDKLTLYWDGAEAAEKTWYGTPDPDTLFVTVAQGLLGHGEHEIYYHLMSYNGAGLNSEPYTLNIDTAAPVLNAGNERLTFPTDIINNGVTAKYLEDNSDEVQAVIPDYAASRPGDVLRWYWDRIVGDREEVASKILTASDIGQPLVVTFEGDMIRSRGDGPRHAYYRVDDRAGNASNYAVQFTLAVAATPIPRDYPWPDIDKASGSGEQVSLVPENVSLEATVIVPNFVLPPGEEIVVQWGVLGQLGEYRTSTPTPAGSRTYAIPKESIAPHIGKVFPVEYEVRGPAGVFRSDVRQVQVQALDTSRLPRIQCMGLSGGNLSLGSIPAGGAPLTLDTWTLMATTQQVRIVVTGTSRTDQQIQQVALDNHPVTDEELTRGIGSRGDVTAPLSFMSQLKLNTPFTLKVYVSFDEGQTWPPDIAPNFPSNGGINLVA